MRRRCGVDLREVVPLSLALRIVNAVLRPFDRWVGRRSRFEADQQLLTVSRQLLKRLDLPEDALVEPSAHSAHLPPGAAEALRQDHPRLLELRKRYAQFSAPVTRQSWWNADFISREVDLHAFRGDMAYLWQVRDFNAAPHYLAAAAYAATVDRHGLLQKLEADDLFGARAYRRGDGVTLSRDLLDSVLELSFLDRHAGLFGMTGATWLDIGAGYGRLAHRAVRALPSLKEFICTDAIAESTFLSEYYVHFRGVDSVARVVPLDEIEAYLANRRVDIASNIHSFSEMPHAAICWWLDRVAASQAQWLFVVPNAMDNGGEVLVSAEPDGSRRDFAPAILERGYELAVREPKYLDPLVQRHGVTPTYYWLFRRKS